MQDPANMLVWAVLVTGAIVSVSLKKLTLLAGISGIAAGWLVFAGAGYTGLIMLAAFFILGTAATSWHKADKGTAAQSTRTAGQVLANGGIAALAGLAILLIPPYTSYLRIAMAASLASATADTLSSELGILYGKRFYNILTLKRDQRGLDGVVSLEGTLIGVIGSSIIALIYTQALNTTAGIIILAGTIGNLTDSVLGAALERKRYIGNNLVNFLNTLVAAVIAAMLHRNF